MSYIPPTPAENYFEIAENSQGLTIKHLYLTKQKANYYKISRYVIGVIYGLIIFNMLYRNSLSSKSLSQLSQDEIIATACFAGLALIIMLGFFLIKYPKEAASAQYTVAHGNIYIRVDRQYAKPCIITLPIDKFEDLTDSAEGYTKSTDDYKNGTDNTIESLTDTLNSGLEGMQQYLNQYIQPALKTTDGEIMKIDDRFTDETQLEFLSAKIKTYIENNKR